MDNQPDSPPAPRLVLVTRPKSQGVATARALRGRGYRSLLDPMLSIRALPQPADLGADAAAVILTSANGALGLGAALAAQPVFAVGAATAAAARARGARRVVAGPSDGRALAAVIRKHLKPSAGALLHLAGDEVREGIQEELEDAGFDYRRIAVYRTEPASRLGPRTVAALERGELDAALFFSPRTALVFADLVREHGLAARLDRVAACCLSEAIAEPLEGLPWRATRISERRDHDTLLGCLESLTQ
jgi:uroporphyrinogen-III synthase